LLPRLIAPALRRGGRALTLPPEQRALCPEPRAAGVAAPVLTSSLSYERGTRLQNKDLSRSNLWRDRSSGLKYVRVEKKGQNPSGDHRRAGFGRAERGSYWLRTLSARAKIKHMFDSKWRTYVL